MNVVVGKRMVWGRYHGSALDMYLNCAKLHRTAALLCFGDHAVTIKLSFVGGTRSALVGPVSRCKEASFRCDRGYRLGQTCHRKWDRAVWPCTVDPEEKL